MKQRNPRLGRRDRWLAAAGAVVGTLVLRLLALTWRLQVVSGEEHAERLLAGGGPAILTAWHNRIFVCGYYVWSRLVGRGLKVGLLVSLSRDGELMARAAGRAGLYVVRGSASMGGLSALRRLRRMLLEDRLSVGTAADGSRGPLYDPKPGTLVLAQLSGAPILPLGGAADRGWRLGSWDRLIVPKPFARIRIAVGAPVHVPPNPSSAELAEGTRQLGATLTELVERAEQVPRGDRQTDPDP